MSFALSVPLALIITFLFGVANFVLHKAILASRHPVLGAVPWFFNLLAGRASVVVEFTMLAGTMLLVAQGATLWAWLYGGYSTVSALSAWLILTGRV